MDSQDDGPGSGDMASADPAAAEPGGGPGPARASLLLVDNDARIVELLTWFLSQRGYDVRTAASFVEARERLAERAPDLLVSDVDLGAESAVQELPRLRADGILPRTLVVSGYLDATVQAALGALPEVVGTLPKPFEFTDLEASIEAALRAGEVGGPKGDAEEGAADDAAGDAADGTSDPLPGEGVEVPRPPAAVEAAASFEVPRPGMPPVPDAEDPGSASGAAAEEDDDEDGWIEIRPGP